MELKKKIDYGRTISPVLSEYQNKYLTLEPITSGFIFMRILVDLDYDDNSTIPGDIYYSKDNGHTWDTLPLNDSTNNVYGLTVEVGEKILLKSNVSQFEGHGDLSADHTSSINYVFNVGTEDETDLLYSQACEFNASGNIMSLFYGDAFRNYTEFPSGLIKSSCYCMFRYSGIRDASNLILPATQLGSIVGCYERAFAQSHLTKAPKIPAAYLGYGCYFAMFAGCLYLTGDIIIPEPLGVADAAADPYEHMFTGLGYVDNPVDDYSELNVTLLCTMCSSLWQTYHTSIFKNIIDRYKTNATVVMPWDEMRGLHLGTGPYGGDIDYVYNRFFSQNYEELINGYSSNMIGSRTLMRTDDVFGSVMRICKSGDFGYNWSSFANYLKGRFSIYDKIEVLEPLQYFIKQPLTFEILKPTVIQWGTFVSTGSTLMTDLEYTLDGQKWIQYKNPINLPAGSVVSWRTSKNVMENEDSNFQRAPIFKAYLLGSDPWTQNGEFNIYGNIMSLVYTDYTNPQIANIIPSGECFRETFMYANIINAKNLVLPATQLTNDCYNGMFESCEKMVMPPHILPTKNPRNVGGCYKKMFSSCTSLQNSPVLMLSSLGEFGSSDTGFSNYCIGLCHRMFENCSSLWNIQKIYVDFVDTRSAIDGSNGLGNFSYMYYGCESIQYVYVYSHAAKPGYYEGIYNYGGDFDDFLVWAGSNPTSSVYAYTKYNETMDLPLHLASIGIGWEVINMHESGVINPEDQPITKTISIDDRGRITNLTIPDDCTSWQQLYHSGLLNDINGKSFRLYGGDSSIKGYKIGCEYYYDTSAGGTSGRENYGANICKSTSLRDVVYSTDQIQIGKTYYIQRYMKNTW